MSGAPRRLVGIGAGGHARVLIDIARQQGDQVVALLDANPALWGGEVAGVPVLGDEPLIPALLGRAPLPAGQPDGDARTRGVLEAGPADALFVSIGGVPSNRVRRMVFTRLREAGHPLVGLVHPTATVAPDVVLGEAPIIMAGAIINPGTTLGTFTIINTGALVEHDCRIGDYAHICPGARLAGNVTVDEGAFVGLGACVIQGVRIGAEAVVGAGAVVLRDVPAGRRAVGNPAHLL